MSLINSLTIGMLTTNILIDYIYCFCETYIGGKTVKIFVFILFDDYCIFEQYIRSEWVVTCFFWIHCTDV